MSPAYIPTLFQHVGSPTKRKAESQLASYNRRNATKRRRLDAMHQEKATMTLLELSSNTEPEGNMDSTTSDVQEDVDLCRDSIADVDDSQTCVSSVSQSTGTMTELTSEFVEDLMICNALRVENLELKKKLRDVMIPECFVDDAKVTFFTGLPCRKILDAIFEFTSPYVPNSRSVLLPFHQFIMVLMKLHINAE